MVPKTGLSQYYFSTDKPLILENDVYRKNVFRGTKENNHLHLEVVYSDNGIELYVYIITHKDYLQKK